MWFRKYVVIWRKNCIFKVVNGTIAPTYRNVQENKIAQNDSSDVD